MTSTGFKNNIVNAILILIILSLLNCKKGQDVNQLYGKWVFVCFKKSGACVKEAPPDDANKMFIMFFSNSNISVGGQCNGASGTFVAEDNGKIEITPLISTGLMCNHIEWEEKYHTSLAFSEKFKISGNKLKIYFNQPSFEMNILQFNKVK
jgi:hypothetical protein